MLLTCAALTGCGDITVDPYPTDLRYPVRNDVLVISRPSEEIYTPDGPGQLEQWVAATGTKTGGKALDPANLPQSVRNEIGKELRGSFGTPAKPKVVVRNDKGEVDDSADDLIDRLKLDEDTLAEGSRQYRRNCLHCHGLPGDGRGPTGPWLNPHPRDYRRGLFKFISTAGNAPGRKPRRVDLLRTLHRGVDGTSMPSFGLESPEVLDQLVSYVMHLSIRGQVEFDTLNDLLDAKKTAFDDNDRAAMRDKVREVLNQWAAADKPNVPPDYKVRDADLKASIARGFKLFIDPAGAASCVKCHIDYGRQSPFQYDDWGTLVRPANLTAGVYRGGRRPVDIYWRVMGGIPGAGMPGAGMAPDQAWDLVNFVLNVPYPNMLPDDVRARVYPERAARGGEEHASAR
jgi:mono/diheme cytochrome c family protein